MPDLQPKEPSGKIMQATNATCNAIDVILEAIRRYEYLLDLYSYQDEFVKRLHELAEKKDRDPKELEKEIARINVARTEEMARVFRQRLEDHCIPSIMIDVAKTDEKALKKNTIARDSMGQDVGLETWLVIEKQYEDRAKAIYDRLAPHEHNKKLTVDQILKMARNPVQPVEMTVVQNLSDDMIRQLRDDMYMPRIYTVVRRDNVFTGQKENTLIFPSVYEKEFREDLISAMGHMTHREHEIKEEAKNIRVEAARKYLKIALDDRKSFFLANMQPDGTYKGGIAVDKNGAKRLAFIEGQTYVIKDIPRDSRFQQELAHIMLQYQDPGYINMTGKEITLENLEKEKDNIIHDVAQPVKETARDIAIAHKNHLIQEYLAPVMDQLVSTTIREDALGRIKNAKWHALENSLIYEAGELGKDEAEGSALTTPQTRGSLRGVDMNTVRDGFDQKDSLGYTTRDELGRILGLNETEMAMSGITKADDPRLEKILNADPQAKKFLVEEMTDFYTIMHVNENVMYCRADADQIEASLADNEPIPMLVPEYELERDN